MAYDFGKILERSERSAYSKKFLMSVGEGGIRRPSTDGAPTKKIIEFS